MIFSRVFVTLALAAGLAAPAVMAANDHIDNLSGQWLIVDFYQAILTS
jgi:hypothetical protein